MKKQFTLALVALAALCALTGCGNRGNNADNTTPNNGSASVTTPDGSTSGNGLAGDVENGLDDAGNAIGNGLNDVGEAITGNNGATSGTNNGATSGTNNGATSGTNNGAASGTNNGTVSSGVPYDQMLDNGRVHDSDGFLTDGENSRSYRRQAAVKAREMQPHFPRFSFCPRAFSCARAGKPLTAHIFPFSSGGKSCIIQSSFTK